MKRPNAEDYIDLKLINDKELQQLFTELIPAVQNKVVLQGMRMAGNEILQQAKNNFKSRQKNKSLTGYKEINRSFSMEPLHSTFGLKIGIKYYKARWIEWGTAERYYKSGKKSTYRPRRNSSNTNLDKHYTGRIQPTNFFYDAVRSNKESAQNKISESIIKSLEKTVQKYNNANNKLT